MGTVKIDRTKIFLYLVFFLYLWDLTYFVGLRNPARFPHSFSLFTTLGDVEFLRGFAAMLREIIFSFASGSLIGVAIGALVLHSSWLTQAIRDFLRVAVWFPLIIFFAGMAPFILGVTAAMLCACYYYIAGRSLLGLEAHQAWTYAAREALLQSLLIILIAQLWIPHWQWFGFTIFMKADIGLEVFTVLVALVGFINWWFHSSFELLVNRRAALQIQEINRERGKSIFEFALFTAACLAVWELLRSSGLNVLPPSPSQALIAANTLFLNGEIWKDTGLSLLEVAGGIVLAGLAAQAVFVALSRGAIFRKLLCLLLPVTYISAIVLWLIGFIWIGTGLPGFLYFWHKVIAVGCLSFFPLVEALWGLRDRPIIYRVLLALDNALPIAFVAMAFGEAYAATQGLGFLMVVANATGQSGKALAVGFITFALIAVLSFALRWAAKLTHVSVEKPQIVPT